MAKITFCRDGGWWPEPDFMKVSDPDLRERLKRYNEEYPLCHIHGECSKHLDFFSSIPRLEEEKKRDRCSGTNSLKCGLLEQEARSRPEGDPLRELMQAIKSYECRLSGHEGQGTEGAY